MSRITNSYLNLSLDRSSVSLAYACFCTCVLISAVPSACAITCGNRKNDLDMTTRLPVLWNLHCLFRTGSKRSVETDQWVPLQRKLFKVRNRLRLPISLQAYTSPAFDTQKQSLKGLQIEFFQEYKNAACNSPLIVEKFAVQ